MEVKNGFTKMNISEFLTWLNNTKVTRKIKVVQLHHTWSPAYKHFNGSNHFTMQNGMRSYHKGVGYSDIAQNFTIFPDGTILTGRSLNVAPAGIVGANTNGICIENVGNFDKGGDTMRESQKDAIIMVTAALLKKFNLTPENGVTYHAWWTANGTSLGDYKQGCSCKTCPGTAFFGGNTRKAFTNNLLPLLKQAMNGKYKNNTTENKKEEEEEVDIRTIDVKEISTNNTTKLKSIFHENENYIRLRELEKFNIKIGYDAATKTPSIDLSKEVKELNLSIDGTDIKISSLNQSNKNYVSVREVLEALGYNVDYDPETKTVIAKTSN